MVEVTRVLVGLFLFAESCIILSLNLFVMTCIIKSRLYAKKDNSVYLLSGFNIAAEICQLLLHVLYISPSLMAGSWFFGGQDSIGVEIVSVVFLGLWYLGSVLQILFAANRFVVVCFPTRTSFTRERVVYLFVLCFLVAAGMVTYSQILSPCCRITPDPRVFGYSYLEAPGETFNPLMHYVDLPLDMGTSVICGLSYLVMVEITRVLLGLLLFSESCIVLSLNLFVMACIIKSRLYAKKDNSVYLLSGFNIAVEICQLLLHVFYICPSLMARTWFFDGQDSLGVGIISSAFLGLWYLGSVLQILFAANRFVVVCFPTRTFFTRERVVYLFILCFLSVLGMLTYTQILSPCCRITPDPRVFAYSYLEVPGETFNPSMYYVDLPLDVVTSIICGVSYIVLFTYIIKTGSLNDKVGRRELRYCVQFLLMFLTYTVTWLTFFVCPAIGIKIPEAYVITPGILVLNGGINSIIYLILNKEIRCAANHVFGRTLFETGTLRHAGATGQNQVHPSIPSSPTGGYSDLERKQ